VVPVVPGCGWKSTSASVNHERVDEALATDASKIATGCPFCRVMITDGVGDRDRAGG
jgi:Fe-S oxidoreductase